VAPEVEGAVHGERVRQAIEIIPVEVLPEVLRPGEGVRREGEQAGPGQALRGQGEAVRGLFDPEAEGVTEPEKALPRGKGPREAAGGEDLEGIPGGRQEAAEQGKGKGAVEGGRAADLEAVVLAVGGPRDLDGERRAGGIRVVAVDHLGTGGIAGGHGAPVGHRARMGPLPREDCPGFDGELGFPGSFDRFPVEAETGGVRGRGGQRGIHGLPAGSVLRPLQGLRTGKETVLGARPCRLLPLFSSPLFHPLHRRCLLLRIDTTVQRHRGQQDALLEGLDAEAGSGRG